MQNDTSVVLHFLTMNELEFDSITNPYLGDYEDKYAFIEKMLSNSTLVNSIEPFIKKSRLTLLKKDLIVSKLNDEVTVSIRFMFSNSKDATFFRLKFGELNQNALQWVVVQYKITTY